MKRGPKLNKRTVERRKRPRSAAKAPVKAVQAQALRNATEPETRMVSMHHENIHGGDAARESRTHTNHHDGAQASAGPDACYSCSKKLSGDKERALFVEEEVGRIFCSENCIAAYFTPEIERLEKEYFRRLASTDLLAEERESLAHLRWITLQEPDEIWREKTLSGDYRYTLISEFKPGTKKVWSICICLFLRGEPSFLYLALATRNTAMVNAYRRGERVEWAQPARGAKENTKDGEKIERYQSHRKKIDADKIDAEKMGIEKIGAELRSDSSEQGSSEEAAPTDRLGDPWTADETFMARMNQERRSDDIPPEEFGQYQACIEQTLETPDEVWSLRVRGPKGPKLYHFLRQHQEQPGVWYVIVAREIMSELVDQEDQIEILDAFPTRDPYLVESYRQGEQEVGQDSPAQVKTTARVVH